MSRPTRSGPSRAGSLVLILGPHAGSSDGEELLRIATGMAACGDEVTLAEVSAGVGALARDDLSAEAERYVEGLASLGIEAREIETGDLSGALGSAARVLVLSAPDRPRIPALLVLDDDYLNGVPADRLLAELTNAGGVVRG